MAPATDYTLIVWASNGYRSKVVTSEITTEGLARVKKGTGTYTYSLFFLDEDGKPQAFKSAGLCAERENVTANFVAREIPANSVVKKIEFAKKSAELVK